MLLSLICPAVAQEIEENVNGPAYSQFQLTLTSGYRCEAVGPLYFEQEIESQSQWGLPPFFCYTRTPDVDWTEWEFFYPIVSYRRFGPEYRLQIVEFFNFSGGKTFAGSDVKHFTLFPFYFQERSPNTNLNYTAVVPFYGHLKNRLFHDEITFVLFPLYSETRKRDVITDNYLFPIFDVRRGDHLTGKQFWPIVGVEHKTPSLRTNSWDETEIVSGYDKLFAAWPFFVKNSMGLGTTNWEDNFAIVPFYSHQKTPVRDAVSYGWPFGYNIIDDRGQGYVEHDVIWPLFVKARGSKTITRIFPAYSHAANTNLESDFICWPVYKFNHLKAPPLDRQRTRILFFLYSDIHERNLEDGAYFRRVDFWPFYTFHHEMDGNERLQVLALLEPFLPNNRSTSREYSPLWSVWRAEKNARTHASSQSLLWNLYRREEAPGMRKLSLFFGLFKYQSTAHGGSWRFGHWTTGKKPAQSARPEP